MRMAAVPALVAIILLFGCIGGGPAVTPTPALSPAPPGTPVVTPTPAPETPTPAPTSTPTGTGGGYTPTSCTFPPGISCVSFKLTTDGKLHLTIGQATGHRIRITGASCTQSPTPQNWTEQAIELRNGESGALPDLTCTTAAGAVATGTQGWIAKFKVWLNYTETDTDTTRQVLGDITARYEP